MLNTQAYLKKNYEALIEPRNLRLLQRDYWPLIVVLIAISYE